MSNKINKIEENEIVTQSSKNVIWPHSRTYVQDMDLQKCNYYEDGKCRSIQIRNVPDYGFTTVTSNPGCDRHHSARNIQCPETDQWVDSGRTTYFGNGIRHRCDPFGTLADEDVHGAGYHNSDLGNGRMRRCRRTNLNTPALVTDVCQMRWILRKMNKLPTGDECKTTKGTTCGDINDNSISNANNEYNTDLEKHYNNEFILPKRYPYDGLAPALAKNFHASIEEDGINTRQYYTCNSSDWNIVENDKNLKTIEDFFKNTANLVLPDKQLVEIDDYEEVLSPELIDAEYAVGFLEGKSLLS